VLRLVEHRERHLGEIDVLDLESAVRARTREKPLRDAPAQPVLARGDGDDLKQGHA
jgi:hypothetical protein